MEKIADGERQSLPPCLDGFELCRQMRSYDSHTPILFFSGADREADKKMAIRLEPMLTLSSPTLVTCSEVLLVDEGQNLRVLPQ